MLTSNTDHATMRFMFLYGFEVWHWTAKAVSPPCTVLGHLRKSVLVSYTHTYSYTLFKKSHNRCV